MPRITELPDSTTPLVGADTFPVVRSGVTMEATFNQLRPVEFLLEFVAAGTISTRAPYAMTIDAITTVGGTPGTISVTDDTVSYTLNSGTTIAADSALVFTATGVGRALVTGRRL